MGTNKLSEGLEYYKDTQMQACDITKPRRSAVTEKSRDASCHRIFCCHLSHSRSFEMTLLSSACVSPYIYSSENMSVCRSVSEISVKEWRDLETGDRGRSRSLKMAPLDTLYTTFYWSVIVSIALCCTIFDF